MDELKQIRTFLKVVDTGSFSAAARDMSSVSSVTRQIKALESELGARLLNRSSRRLSLTEAGHRLYDRAGDIVNELDSLKAEVKSLEEEVTGTLRVALRVSTGTTVVVPALPRLLARYPDLVVEVILTDERLDLIANKIDVALWMGNLPDSDLIARPLTPTHRIICASKAYLAAHGTPVEPEDLRHHQCILYTAPSYGNVWTIRKGERVHEIEARGNVRANNGLVLISAALQGMGLILVHEWMVRAHLDRGELVPVLEDCIVSPHPSDAVIHAVYPGSRRSSRKVRVFVDFLIETFNELTSERPGPERPIPSTTVKDET